MFTKLSNIEHFSEEDDFLPEVTIIEEPKEMYNKNIQSQRLDPDVMFSQRIMNNTDVYDTLRKERKIEQHLQRLEQMERNSNESMIEQYFTRQIEKMKHKETMAPKSQISCVEIAKHIENCPVCSKLYNQKNETETVYIKEDKCEDCSKWKNWCIMLGALCIILFLIILKIYLSK